MKLYSKVVCAALLLGSSFNFSIDIFQAIEQGDKKVIKQWLQDSSDVNVVNEQGQTVLMQAVIKNNKRLVKKLLKKGAEVNALDMAGKTALDYAAEDNTSSIVLRLVKYNACVTTDYNAKIVNYIIEKRARMLFFLSLGLGFVLIPLTAGLVFVGAIVICNGVYALTTIYIVGPSIVLAEAISAFGVFGASRYWNNKRYVYRVRDSL